MNIFRFSSFLFTIAVVLCFQGCQSGRRRHLLMVANVEVAGVVQKDVPVYQGVGHDLRRVCQRAYSAAGFRVSGGADI